MDSSSLGTANVATTTTGSSNDSSSSVHHQSSGQGSSGHQSYAGHNHYQQTGPGGLVSGLINPSADQRQQQQQQMYQNQQQQFAPVAPAQNRDSNSSLGHHRHPSITSVSSTSNPRLNTMSGSNLDLRFGPVNMNQSFPGMYSGAQVPPFSSSYSSIDPSRGYSYHDITSLVGNPSTPVVTSSPMFRGGFPSHHHPNPSAMAMSQMYPGMDMYPTQNPSLNHPSLHGMAGNSIMNQSFGQSSSLNASLMTQGMMNPMAAMQQSMNPAANNLAANAALQNWMVQYSQWWHYMENRRREAARMAIPAAERPRLTPHRYPHRHSRPSFGSKNELIITFGTSVYIQQIDPGLIDFGESVQVTAWPGPLIKSETNKDDVLEYIRLREASLKADSLNMIKDNETVISESIASTGGNNHGHVGGYDISNYRNHEKRQIWLLLSMLVKQNGIISGPDITELLVSQNESDFADDDDSNLDGDDDGVAMDDNKRNTSQLRRYLMLGQRKIALEHASRTGLWGHAFALTFLKPVQQSSPGQGSEQQQVPPTAAPHVPDPSMVSMVSKFMNTLDRNDPLSILYRSLLAKVNQGKGVQFNTNKVITTDNLKQFSILLANDCEVGSVVSNSRMTSELLKLIVQLRNNATQSLINISRLDKESNNVLIDEKGGSSLPSIDRYTDEFVFVNEILEFARPSIEFIEALVPFKLRLTTRLFDFGHVAATTKYCYVIKQYYLYYNHFFPGKDVKTNSKLDWPSILSIVNDIECKLWGFDVTHGQYSPPKEEEEIKSRVDGDSKKTISGGVHEESGAEEEESISKDEEEVSEDDDDADETDTNSNAVNAITSKMQQMRPLATVPEVEPSHKGRGQRHDYGRQDSYGRRDTYSSEVSDSRSASPQKQSLSGQRTSSVSSATNYNQNRVRSMSNDDTATPPSTTPSPGHAPPVQMFPATKPAASSSFFMPAPVSSEQPPPDNFLSDPVQYKPAINQEANNISNDNDDSNDGMSGMRRDSMGYNHSGSFNNQAATSMNPVMNSTAAPGFGGMMAPRDTLGSPGLSAFSPISSPAINTDDLIKPRSYSQSRNDGVQGTNGHPNSNGGNKEQLEGASSGGNKANKSGWFGNIIAKVVPQGPVRAKLPDDSNPSIYYDEKLKRWIDKDNPDDGALMDAIANGPPKMPMMAGGGGVGMNRSSMGGSQMIGPQSQQQPASMGMMPGPQQPLQRSSMGQSMPSLSVAQMAPLPGSDGLNGGNSFSFVKRSSNRPKYVDAWQLQHSKKD